MASQGSSHTKVIGHKSPDIKYVERSAVRAILYNAVNDQIAVVHIAKGNYFKLPGGGVEDDEDHTLAVAREVLEETGCKGVLEDKKYFARSEEWRNDLHQISYCFVVKLVEDTGKPEITELESQEGLTHTWLNIKDALRMMRDSQPDSELGNFIKERDLFFVETFASSIK
jgi:8-oxo-dGTP pyrophosphatase MutT (NUDIX family)